MLTPNTNNPQLDNYIGRSVSPLSDAELRASPLVVSVVSGSTPVDGSGFVQPVTAGALRTSLEATIPTGTSVSNVLDLISTAVLAFTMPATWTAAALSIEVSSNNANWFGVVMSPDASQVNTWSAPTINTAYTVDPVSFLPFRYVRIRSGTLAAPVNQVAARVITVLNRALV